MGKAKKKEKLLTTKELQALVAKKLGKKEGTVRVYLHANGLLAQYEKQETTKGRVQNYYRPDQVKQFVDILKPKLKG